MTSHFEKRHYLIITIAPIISGFFVYSILSYLLVSPGTTIPVSIIISMLIFGLIKYYSTSQVDINDSKNGSSSLGEDQKNYVHDKDRKKENGLLSYLIFVTIFAIVISISAFTVTRNELHIFISWNDLGMIGIIQLGAAIMLCFFMPGYAVVLILTKKYKVNPILAVLLGYFFSMLITGLTAYISALYFDSAISESKNLFIAMYVGILITFLIRYRLYKISVLINLLVEYLALYHYKVTTIMKFWNYLKTMASQLLVFGSLLMLLIVATYYLYGGITISDQWFHQGRALLFLGGSFREAAIDGADHLIYPAFQSALLAALTAISGIPLVNSYASIAFLNITPVFAFYYFFSKWVTPKLYRASTLASSLFAIGSGFSWIYFLGLTITTHPISSQHSFLEILNSIRTVTIIRPTNFIFSAEPDFSTGLIYIALPAGLVLLGLLRETFGSKLYYTAAVTSIAAIGILSHDEFYFFIIIGSLLPLIFKIEKQNYLYVGLILSISIIFLIDTILPGNYYSSIQIFGVSLLYLNALFVFFTWAFYLGRTNLRRLRPRIISSRAFPRRTFKVRNRTYFLSCVIIISFSTYLYFLSYIILAQLPIEYVKNQTQGYVVPWYLYPMKLGILGIFGLVFALSYFVRRFEKGLFVFGIIIIVAFITGNYYDEHRFSKYIMFGMIGYSSVFFYRILNSELNNRLIANTILISVIITCASLSVLMYIGSNSLVLETQDYTINPKRKFPSMSEIDLFDKLRLDMDINSKKYNIESFPNEYNQTKGSPLMPKLQGFSGFPFAKLLQSPLTLNASTLDAFYRLLDYSDARYIILPKDSINDGNVVTEPTSFALHYFKRFYEDKNYTVLYVPPLEPPSSSPKAAVALLYNLEYDLPQVYDKRLLLYNNNTFKNLNDSGPIRIGSKSESVILLGSKMDKGIPLWSRVIPPEAKINYIETKFRITSENENKSNDIRLKWREGDKEYYVSLSKNGLELYQQSVINGSDRKILSKNTEVQKMNWIWYMVKIERLNSSINVYVDNVQKIHASNVLTDTQNESISRIGLTSLFNNIEFGPLKIGKVREFPSGTYYEKRYYSYYYPLSLLALSKTPYDIFNDADLSAFSKSVMLISDISKSDKDRFNMYMKYVSAGGRLIVINSFNNFSSTFGQLFSIESNNATTEEFTDISTDRDVLINVSGFVKGVDIESNPDVKVIASYNNRNNHTIAPFVLEKTFSNHGKIVLINAGGYFNAISNSPNQYFFSLRNISKILGLEDSNKLTTSRQNTSTPLNGFIGNMEVTGKVRLSSPSVSLLDQDSYPYVIEAARIVIFNKTNDLPITFDNVSIKNLRIVGRYNAVIDFSGRLEIPNMMSDRNYIGTSLPTDFNMTVSLYPERLSYMEIVTQNNSSTNSIKVDNDSKVEFYKIRAQTPLKSVNVLLKDPEIKVNGETSINNALLNGFLTQRGTLNTGNPLDILGQLNAKFGFVDNYNQHYRNGTRSNYITYLQSITMNGVVKEHKKALKLPADIASFLNDQELATGLKKAIGSPSNIILIVVLITLTIIVSKLIWNKRNL